MSELQIVYTSLFMAVLSLIVVSLLNSFQAKKRLQDRVFNELKRRASELVDLEITIEPFLESPTILLIINEEVIDTIVKMRQLNPSNPFIDIGMENAQNRANALSEGDYKINTYRYVSSDAAIVRAQMSLNEAAKIIRKRQAEGKLEVSEMDMHIAELQWAHLMVSVITFVAQGHKATEVGNILRAHSFYKRAFDLVSQGGYRDERQNQYISELTEILNNKRKTLSYELMPETDLNPNS